MTLPSQLVQHFLTFGKIQRYRDLFLIVEQFRNLITVDNVSTATMILHTIVELLQQPKISILQ